ncbi:MAG: glycosyltransferase family 2 protein [Vicinamibacterales bacterium]
MVSVIIPAFRSAGYIAATVASVFNQSYRDFEVIVVNDGSPDTPQLIDALASRRDSVVYLEQENGGAGAARNAGLARARGDLVAFLDADDRWLPHFLESQVAFLSAHPGRDMVYANARITGDTPLAGRTFMDTTPSEGPVSFQSLLLQQCTVITSSVVARRAAIEAVGGFDTSLRRGQDFDLWLRLAHGGAHIFYQREPLIERIVLADGLSADPITELKRAIGVLKGVHKKLALDPHDCTLLRRRITVLGSALELERGKRCLRHGRFDEARGHFQRSLALIPCWKVRLVLMLVSIAPRAFQRAYVRLRPATRSEILAAQ